MAGFRLFGHLGQPQVGPSADPILAIWTPFWTPNPILTLQTPFWGPQTPFWGPQPHFGVPQPPFWGFGLLEPHFGPKFGVFWLVLGVYGLRPFQNAVFLRRPFGPDLEPHFGPLRPS